jgi:hypothetical protein
VISPIANGIIDAPNERQPHALDARRCRDSTSDREEETSVFAARLVVRISDKILSTIERNF